MVDLILFPSSYFSIKKVDEDLQGEYEAVMGTGLFDVVLFGDVTKKYRYADCV